MFKKKKKKGKEEVRPVWRHNLLHRRSEDSVRKWLVSEFSKVAGYRFNIKKSIAFLYTNSRLSRKIIRKRILIIVALKRIKYLEINFPKEIKDLYNENYETLMEEIEDTSKWKDSLCS